MLLFIMLVTGTGIVYEFIVRYPDSQSSLTGWLQVMRSNEFENPNQLKQTFPSADYVKPYTVFNISGNKYRLISVINYTVTVVAVQDVLTHPEYDKGKWRK